MTGNNSQGGATSTKVDGNGKGNGPSNGATTTASTNAEISAMHDFIAGGIAGSASVIVGRKLFSYYVVCELKVLLFLILLVHYLLHYIDPFDTIKVRMQTQFSTSSNDRSIRNGTGAGTMVSTTTTTPATTSSSSTTTSIKSLFRGMAAPLSTAAIVNAIIFSSYGYFMRVWETNTHLHGGQPYNFPGTMTGEGAVFVERGEEGLHEYIRHHPPLSSSSSSSHAHGEDGGHHRINSESSSSIEAAAATPQPKQQSDFLRVFTCGAMAGTAQAFVICPMEHIKCRLQIVGATYHGPLDACLSITKSHGIFRGLYRGMGVTLWRETPAFGMYFATYDAAKAQAERLLKGGMDGGDIIGTHHHDNSHSLSPSHAHAWAASALAGGISGAWTWAIIYPFDVIKTTIQTGSLDCRKGMWTVGREIVRTHGIRHMFRGLGVTLARAFPVNAVIFPTYEFVLLQLGDGG